MITSYLKTTNVIFLSFFKNYIGKNYPPDTFNTPKSENSTNSIVYIQNENIEVDNNNDLDLDSDLVQQTENAQSKIMNNLDPQQLEYTSPKSLKYIKNEESIICNNEHNENEINLEFRKLICFDVSKEEIISFDQRDLDRPISSYMDQNEEKLGLEVVSKACTYDEKVTILADEVITLLIKEMLDDPCFLDCVSTKRTIVKSFPGVLDIHEDIQNYVSLLHDTILGKFSF